MFQVVNSAVKIPKKIILSNILVAFITLHGLLLDSGITLFWYIYNAQTAFLAIIVVLYIAILLLNKPKIKDLLILILPIGLALYTAFRFYNYNILFLLLVMLLSCFIDMDSIISVIYKTTLLFFIIHFIIFNISFLFPVGFRDYNVYSNGIIRYSFFTIHPNYIARIFIFCISLYCYNKKFKVSILNWSLIFALTIYMYYFTRSDALYLVFVCFVFAKVVEARIFTTLSTFLVRYGIPLFTMFSLSLLWSKYIPILNDKLMYLNILMSNRLSSNIKVLDFYGITFFGKNSEFGREFVYQGKTYEWYFADNMYVYTLVHWGAIYLILLSLLLFFSAKAMDNRARAMVIILLLYGIGENGVTAVYTSFSLLLAYYSFSKEPKYIIKI